MTDTIFTAKKRGKPALTKEIVSNRIADRGIALVGDYVNAKTKTTFECGAGHQWDAVPATVMYGGGCPHCSKNARLTKETVSERIADRGLRMVGDYVNALTKSTFECAEGHRWDARPDVVMYRSPCCPVCSERLDSRHNAKGETTCR